MGIGRRIAIGEPLAAGEPGVDVLEVTVESLEALVPESREIGWVVRVAFGPTDMGVGRMHGRREVSD
jgi:hypothetical protein